jgi:quinoprotein glucose dehydrogenase
MNYRYVLVWMILIAGLSGCDSGPDTSGTQQTGPAGEIAPVASAQPPVAAVPAGGGDWEHYNHELNGMRYSPLGQINRDNVTGLQEVWSHPAGGQSTPIVIDGIMYLPASNGVAAVEADTGHEIWAHDMGEARPSQRGVAYWPGEGDLGPRILFMSGNNIIALDAATGQPAHGFGEHGKVEVGVPYNSVPTIYRHVVMIGANTREHSIGESGNTRAYDARTGEKLWEFNTVPRPGEVGHETWLDGSWDGRSGVNVWAFSMTVDTERGILYMPVSGAAGNYSGGDRPGANLFANSVVAVNALTGEYLWHFQTVHHGLWDEDQPSPPALFDLEKDGETIPALALIGKTSYLFILNRVTGEPIYEVEERPVPAGDVPGEWYSPTQPFPVKPPPLSRVSFDKEKDMVTAADTTPEHVAACQKLWDDSGGFYNAGPFTPFLFHKEGDPPKSTIQFPGGTGGVNWGGPAVDPTTGYIIVNAHDTSLVGWVEEKKPGLNYGRGVDGSLQKYDRASISGPGPYAGFNAQVTDENGNVIGMWPCQRPPWARLVAVDAKTAEIAWQTVLGINEALPEGKQQVGGSGSAGPTVTAGGLVFMGATNDQRFRAFDSATGAELWVTHLGQVAGANPMTYLGKNGKQYVAIVARNEVRVFALP